MFHVEHFASLTHTIHRLAFNNDMRLLLASALMLLTLGVGAAQQKPQRTRLIMKDGSYQLVLGYQVAGKVVRYQSAERDGETEEVPLALVDLAATERWQQEHTLAQKQAPVLSPELAAEEADRRSKTPEVAPNLRLPDEDSVLVLDQFHSAPELVPLPQEESDLNKETAHAVQKKELNPFATSHAMIELKGPSSETQFHATALVFYVRTGKDEEEDGGGGAMTVDTHGVAGRETPAGGNPDSGYVVERLDVRSDSRVVDSFRIPLLGSGKKQAEVIEMKQEQLPGGHWMRLIPEQPLQPGEYALIEVLNAKEINLNVWDFGVHPNAPESIEAIHPEVKKPVELKSR
jgi:hypothetical protein